MVNPYESPSKSGQRDSHQPLSQITARQLLGWWIVIAVLPTLVLSGLLMAWRG